MSSTRDQLQEDNLIWPDPGKGIEYATALYGQKEIDAVVEVLSGRWLAPAHKTKQFEEKMAEIVGKRHGVFVNSGSSANLIALELANLPKGSEVIVPACTFSTTLAPIVQKGLTPVFVDSEPDTFVTTPEAIERAISPNTKAIIAQHTYGSLLDLPRIQEIAKKNHLLLIEDSCDTVGGKINGKPTGTYSDITTTSFYFVHHITAAGGGGMVLVNDPALEKRCRAFRDWGRASGSGYDEDFDKRFSHDLGGIIYDSKFVFDEIAYNLKGIEAQAAFALVQLERLPAFNEARKKNTGQLLSFFKKYEAYFMLPRTLPNVDLSWMVLMLTIRDGAPFTRPDLLRFMEENKIQTRLVLAGNITRHPPYINIQCRKVGDLKGADKIMKDSFLVPCHPALRQADIERIMETYQKFLSRFS